jgi:hypothetical protein
MISVLSRLADRSMLGLEGESQSIATIECMWSSIVLLHRGSQAGDPAILSEEPSLELIDNAPRMGGAVRRHSTTTVTRTYVALEGTLENQLLSHGGWSKGYSCRSGSTPLKMIEEVVGWRLACFAKKMVNLKISPG